MKETDQLSNNRFFEPPDRYPDWSLRPSDKVAAAEMHDRSSSRNAVGRVLSKICDSICTENQQRQASRSQTRSSKRTRLYVVQLLRRSSSSHLNIGRFVHSKRSRLAMTISHSWQDCCREEIAVATPLTSEDGSATPASVATLRSSRCTKEDSSGPGLADIGVVRDGMVAMRMLSA